MKLKNDSDDKVKFSNRILKLADRFGVYNKLYEANRDERAVCSLAFKLLHVELSETILKESTKFEDLPWVVALSENFAQKFFSAMDLIDSDLHSQNKTHVKSNSSKIATFEPWLDVYQSICLERSYIFECLVFPLFAHIAHDLPISLAETGLEENSISRIGDYHKINDVLSKSINKVQEEIGQRYKGHIAFLDKLSNQFDELLTNYGMRVARSMAWYNAERILNPSTKNKTLIAIRVTPKKYIHSLRNPKMFLPLIVFNVLRLVFSTNKRWPKKV